MNLPQLLLSLFLSLTLVTHAADTTLRVLTYNIHGGGPVTPTPESRQAFESDRTTAGGHATGLLAAKLAPLDLDVIALQEAYPKKFVERLAADLKMHHAYFPGGWQDPDKGWPEGIAGAILTKHKIFESQNAPPVDNGPRPDNIFSRFLGRAVIEIEGQPITVLATHLLPSWKNTTAIRLREISELSTIANPDTTANHLVLALGDMNHQPDTPEHQSWLDRGWLDTFATRGTGSPLTCPAEKPTERIDYIFANPALAPHLVSARVLTTPPYAIDPADPDSYALSDHLPVLAEFTIPASPNTPKDQ